MQFVCRLGTADGRILTQAHAGRDADTLRRELERAGFHIFEIRPRGIALRLPLPFKGRGRRRMPAQHFLAFNQELAALLRAGLPLLQALDLMLDRMENPVLRDVLAEIRDKVKSGAELSEAFASFGDLFPPLYASTLRAGERSGELEQVIRRFIRYQKLVLDARKKVVSALVYPAVLISLSLVMVVILAIYVVPKFSQFYADLDAELPAMTQVTLGISFFLRDHYLLIAGALIIGFFALRRWAATDAGRETIDRWRLSIPLLGTIFHRFALAEFCRSLATLLAGGIPLLAALEIAISSVSNAHVSKVLAPAADDVRQGQAFFEGLERTGIFPVLSLNMIKVGEATGALDEMLTSVSDHFDEQVETRVERLLALIEPVMLVFMGILVSLILISIYLPMFSVLGQVGT